MSSDPSGSLEGQIIDQRYEVQRKLGEGGMGEVFLALDRRTGRSVAVKLPWPWLLGQTPEKERFLQEIRALSRLDHPRIVKVLDVVEWGGRPAQVLQYFSGGTLEQRRDLPLERWLPGIAAALDYLHGEGLVHRDVKPANILLDSQATAFLGDFGIAKLLEGSPKLTQTGFAPGTPTFMAPEAVQGHELDGSTDQYALAMIVYERLANRLPFEADTPWGIAAAQVTSLPLRLPEVDGRYGEATSTVLIRALSKSPSDRFGSCRDFAEAVLQSFEASGDIRSSMGDDVNGNVLLPASKPSPPGLAISAAIGNDTQCRVSDASKNPSHAIYSRWSRRRVITSCAAAMLSVVCLSLAFFANITSQESMQAGATSEPAETNTKQGSTKSVFEIPAQTIQSDLSFTIFVRRNAGRQTWERVGATPGVVDVPECHDRLFQLNDLLKGLAEAYADEMERLGIVHVCVPASDEDPSTALWQLAKRNSHIQSLYLSCLRIDHGFQHGCDRVADWGFLGILDELTTLGLPEKTTNIQLAELRERGFLEGLHSLDCTTCNLCGLGNDQLTDLSSLSGLSTLKSLSLCNCIRITDLSALADLVNLTSLDVQGCQDLSDVSSLAGLWNLQFIAISPSMSKGFVDYCQDQGGLVNIRTLDLSGDRDLSDVSALSKLTSLKSLDLSLCSSLGDISAIASLVTLTSLDLGHCRQIGSLEPLAMITGLRELALPPNVTNEQVQWLRDHGVLKGVTSLKLINCGCLTDVSGLIGLESLRMLDLSNCDKLASVAQLSGVRNLESITLNDCDLLTDLSGLEGLPSVTRLSVAGCRMLTDVSEIGGLRGLRTLDVSACVKLMKIPDLSPLKNLKSLKCDKCALVTDVSGLNGLSNLRTLSLSECSNLVDLSSLSGMTSLGSLDLHDCERLEDVSTLSKLGGLLYLKLPKKISNQQLEWLRDQSVLTRLRCLGLSNCDEITTVSALEGLNNLVSLDLSECDGLPEEAVTSLRGKLQKSIVSH